MTTTEVSVSLTWRKAKSGLHQAHLTIHDLRSKCDLVDLTMSPQQFAAFMDGGDPTNPVEAEFMHEWRIGKYRQEAMETFEVTPSCQVFASRPRPGPSVDDDMEKWLDTLPIVGDEDWELDWPVTLNQSRTAWIGKAVTYSDTDLPGLEPRVPCKALPASA